MTDLRNFVKKVIRETIEKEYAYLRHPAAVRAVITDREQHDGCWEYRIRISGRDGMREEKIPELPCIKSDRDIPLGAEVCVLLMDGGLTPFIVGRCL